MRLSGHGRVSLCGRRVCTLYTVKSLGTLASPPACTGVESCMNRNSGTTNLDRRHAYIQKICDTSKTGKGFKSPLSAKNFRCQCHLCMDSKIIKADAAPASTSAAPVLASTKPRPKRPDPCGGSLLSSTAPHTLQAPTATHTKS